jgi:hypothetical protein
MLCPTFVTKTKGRAQPALRGGELSTGVLAWFEKRPGSCNNLINPLEVIVFIVYILFEQSNPNLFLVSSTPAAKRRHPLFHTSQARTNQTLS